MKPMRCPVCNGSGVVRQEAPGIGMEGAATSVSVTITCHGCSGKGWVEISEVDECVVIPRSEETVLEQEDETPPEEGRPEEDGD